MNPALPVRYRVWAGTRGALRAEWAKQLTVPGPAWLLAAA